MNEMHQRVGKYIHDLLDTTEKRVLAKVTINSDDVPASSGKVFQKSI
jgi:hypothetical protein